MTMTKKCAVFASGDAVHVGHRYFVSHVEKGSYRARWAGRVLGYQLVVRITEREGAEGTHTFIQFQNERVAKRRTLWGMEPSWRARTEIVIDDRGEPTDDYYKGLRFRLLAPRYQPKLAAAAEVVAAEEAL